MWIKKVRFFIKVNILNSEIQYIVPGDILYLKDNMIMPCDAILLEGICTVNESEITGESNLEMKMPIPKNNLPFTFSDNKNSLLYDGIKIVETIVRKIASSPIYKTSSISVNPFIFCIVKFFREIINFAMENNLS